MITVARLGPTSAMRRKKRRKAAAEHTSPSTTIATRVSVAGVSVGKSPMPNGSSMIEAIAMAAVTGPSGSAPARCRLTISGPHA